MEGNDIFTDNQGGDTEILKAIRTLNFERSLRAEPTLCVIWKSGADSFASLLKCVFNI